MVAGLPYKEMTLKDASKILAHLCKTYVDPRIHEDRVQIAIERLEDKDELQTLLSDIAKGLKMARHGLAFSEKVASKKAALAHAGKSVLEKFYFHAADIDNIIFHTHWSQEIADNMTNSVEIERATIATDFRNFRKACTLPLYKDLAQPVLKDLFGPTGPELAYMNPEAIPRDERGENTPAGPAGVE
ncbi:MAG: hypothetical protein LRY76_07405 [Alphaproteobacteria bacterium]|nr:hypothetical protein [Alphaproteobacteria bacterium]MCD8571329.1 hypothetical protein [Alphaproteobacteria bacterium]